MRKFRTLISVAAMASVFALAITGCASGTASSSSAVVGDPTAIITTNGSEPLNPLITTNATEVGGAKILNSIYAGLVSYKADGSIENDVAESITPDSDSKVWTIKIKSGQKFTNDEAVTADSFINAWNYGAKLSNAQEASYFFENIEGFSYTKDTTLTGLKKIDDLTFTVTLKNPAADFPLSLGYTAFYPLPSVAYKDIKAFGEAPIGNGPYKLKSSDAWQHNKQIELVVNPDYSGVRTPKNGGLTIVFYTSLDAAYADAQSGNLDVLDSVSDTYLSTYQKDFPNSYVNQPAAIFQAISIPQYLEHWSGEEGKLRRAAISYAINREEITSVVFQGTRTPATDFTSPVISGWSNSLTGADVLTYNQDQAKKLWAEADAISPYGDTTFTISYNADGGHQTWVDAVAHSISDTLGIKAEGKSYATFKEALQDRIDKKLTGATRAGWQADYPSLFNFLGPIYYTGGSSNLEGYSSTEFDSLIDQGSKATTTDEANSYYQQAQEVLLKDLPQIPLWYQNVTGVWNSALGNVQFGWDSVPLYYEITKA